MTWRSIRRMLMCSRNFTLGAAFAYGTVIVFIMVYVTGFGHPHSKRGRRLQPYSHVVGDQDNEGTLTHLHVADLRNDDGRLDDVRYQPTQMGYVVVRNEEPVLSNKLKVSRDDGSTDAGRPTEAPHGDKAGHSGGDVVEDDDTKQKNQSTPAEVRCVRSKGKRKYDPALDCQKRLPQVIGIGMGTCGRGALAFFLMAHPYITISHPIEIFYWTKHVNESLDWYRERMPVSSKHQVTMEFTPTYFFGRDIPRLIKERAPDTRFIVMLCDPVQKAVTQFLHLKHYHWEGINDYKPLVPGAAAHAFVNDTFETTVVDGDGDIIDGNAIVENGLYDVHLQRWFDVFPQKRFLVIDEGKFIKNPIRGLHRVEAFLDLPTYFNSGVVYLDPERDVYCRTWPQNKCFDDFKERPHLDVQDDVLQKMTDYYRPHNLHLSSLLRRTFSWID